MIRAAEQRADPGLLTRARRDPGTRVLVVAGDTAHIDDRTRLVWVSPEDVPDKARWAFLGRGADGSALLVAAIDRAVDAFPSEWAVSGEGWRGLRVIGGDLSATDADAFATAVALGHWLHEHDYCPACGSSTEIENAGWSRRCPGCGREHFPRTDPAVICAVTAEQQPGRLLLGSNALWGAGRYSCFAGFVEAGESLEAAVRRELAEEAGVHIGNIRYLGSQAWPYPRSLMTGFIAEADDIRLARPDGEEIIDIRWFDRAEVAASLRGEGEVVLPGSSSIAHRLIAQWLAESG